MIRGVTLERRRLAAEVLEQETSQAVVALLQRALRHTLPAVESLPET